MTHAELSDVRTAVAHWSPGQLECRANRNHHWKDQTVLHDPKYHYLRVQQKCSRCLKVTRWREMNEKGYSLSRWQTEYAPGYLLPPGTGPIGDDGMAMLRMAVLKATGFTKMEPQDRGKPRSRSTRGELGL